MKICNDKIKKNLLYLPTILLLLYILGFLVWNIYLFGLKFDEIEILQSRFIYTGFFLALYSLLLLKTLDWMAFHIYKLLKKTRKSLKEVIFDYAFWIALFAVILIFVYSVFIFPMIPRIFGGGTPFALSVLPNKSTLTMQDFADIGVQAAAGSKIQTVHVCVAYENSSSIVILLHDRVVRMNKEQLNGIAALPGDPAVANEERASCAYLARVWSSYNYLTFFKSLFVVL